MSDTEAKLREVAVRKTLEYPWKPYSSAPRDGSHFLACSGPYDQWTGFNQFPPFVIHYWAHYGEEGFYLSSGIVEGSYNDKPQRFTHWMPLPSPPPQLGQTEPKHE